MPKKSSFWLWFGLAAAVGVGFLGWRSFTGLFGVSPDASGVPCINPLLPIPNEYHIHPQLRVVIDGNDVPIPPNVGLSVAGCERALHTHDSTGELHIEPNHYQEFRLGQFFDLWGEPFSREQLLDKRADADHIISMTVDGVPSDAYGDLALKDKQQIVIEYRKRSETAE